MQTGINFYFNLLALDPSLFKVFYGFTGNGGATIPSIPSGNALYSGVLSSVGNFYQYVPSIGGFLTGQNIKITNDSGLQSNDWTMFFTFEKSDNGLGILFSNYHGESIKSGFAIGVNDANHLFFETYSSTGPSVVEANFPLASCNAVSVTKAGNGIYFNLYDSNARTMLSDNHTIDASFVLQSSGWYLGDAINPPSYFSGRAFHGALDSYAYFSAPLLPYQIIRLFSGFFDEVGNPGYLHSFGMNSIAFLEEIDSNDTLELYTFPNSTRKTNANNLAVFDSACGDFILRSTLNQSSINGYVNGVAQLPSGFSVSGTFYNPIYVPSGDYFLSGQNIIGRQYGPNDDFLYDIVTGNRGSIIVPSGYISGHIAPFDYATTLVFLNGIKLRQNADYIQLTSGISLVNSFSGTTGILFSFPLDPSGVYTNGTNPQARGPSGAAWAVTSFPRNTSEFWRNGVRQALGDNYLEISNLSLLVGSGTFFDKPTLYNNISLFWH